jgi:hypothetical protein
LLHARIRERFPQSSLSGVAKELEAIAREAVARTESIRRPNVLLRLASLVLISLLLAIVVLFVRGIKPDTVEKHLSDALDVSQFAESVMGTLVFLGASILFLVTMEIRAKRNRALEAIYELRSLAHVVDMHQLTKDPEALMMDGTPTASSPARSMSPFELGRYLDYCTELLSLVSKIAVLYVQGIRDDDVLNAVDQIETLTTGLSRKIWQKIALLERYRSKPAGTPTLIKPSVRPEGVD